ncbi:hypothetical protein KBJ94_10450 [Pseudomonas sp. ITA]|uniref:hypothetical protein n=1 Tax=Pseudomonas sp. ITA TaxID=2825841 RepID=UPI002497AD17|nr:hypothetical protein [Pseudomonas sp. ITA]MDI2142460.1 hypothetical protein [Pseudomonas sp. ITA]
MTAPTLASPRIPGMKQPVSAPHPVDAGLPLALTHLHPDGVKVFIEPPSGMAVDDTLVLRLNNDLVARKLIANGEEDQRAVLYVQAKPWSDGLNVLEYSQERAGIDIETSLPLRVWFHSKRPGLLDRFPEQEGHSELELKVEQTVLDEGVSPEWARKGVDVRLFYPLMRVFDTILLDCNGVVLRHLVSQTEVDSGQPVVMTIVEATFIAAGDAASFPLRFTVLDCLDNSPDTNSPYSAHLSLYVNLRGEWYDPPIVSEDPNDAEDDPDTIDLEKLSGEPATAQVYVSGSWSRDDEIHLLCRFRDANDHEESLLLIETVKNKPFLYSFPLANKYFASAAGGKASFQYTRVSNGVSLDRSETLRVSIIGTPASDLLPPTLVGSGRNIDPLGFPEGLTARVEFKEAREGDRARLVIEGAPRLGSPEFAPIGFNKNNRANFVLEPKVLAANHGKTIKLSWNLLRDGSSRSSGVNEIIVQRIESTDRRLPIPQVPQALDEVLDMGAFHGPGQVTCAPWPAIGVGQLRWFHMRGVGHDDKAYEITIAVGAPVTGPETTAGLDNALMRDLLLKFKPGTTATLKLTVSFDGSNDELNAVAFQSREYQILNLPATLLEDFTQTPAQTVKKGGVMESSHLKFTFLSGSGECAFMPRADIGQSFPGRVDGQVLSIGRDSSPPEPVVVELELKKACTRCSFWHISSNYNDAKVEYLSADRTLLGSETIGMSYSTPQSVLHAAAGIKILRITCPKADWFSLDRIKVDY